MLVVLVHPCSCFITEAQVELCLSDSRNINRFGSCSCPKLNSTCNSTLVLIIIPKTVGQIVLCDCVICCGSSLIKLDSTLLVLLLPVQAKMVINRRRRLACGTTVGLLGASTP